MKTFFGIEIPKRNSQCAKAQEELKPGSEVFSVISQGDEAFLRDDYCSDCWKTIQNDELINQAITHWRSITPEKKEQKELFLDRDQKALHMLKEMASSEAEEEQHQAYILALYLARRRQIYQRKEFQNEEGEWAVLYEVAGSHEIIPVRRFEFSELGIEGLQRSIAKKLKG